MEVNGAAVASALSQSFFLATNSVTATGGDVDTGFAEVRVLGATLIDKQPILKDYIIDVLGGTADLFDDPNNPEWVIRLDK